MRSYKKPILEGKCSRDIPSLPGSFFILLQVVGH